MTKKTTMEREIFLDNNATTRPLPEVVSAVVEAMTTDFGNPSSSNRTGETARNLLRRSRESVAELLGTPPDTLFFTSGATEANNWIFQEISRKPKCRIVTTATEHSSIKSICDRLSSTDTEIEILPVDKTGRVRVEDIERAAAEDATLVSVHWVNNETGTIQPIEEIASICRQRGVLFHTDASQAVGKLSVNIEKLGCDFLSFSSHKFHGPQGAGGLSIRSGVKLRPILFGGGQENGKRAGTENLPGIAGMGVAATQRSSDLNNAIGKLRGLRDRFESKVLNLIPDVFVNGDVNNRICNTTNLRFAGVNGEALVARLDQLGVRCSQSSACTNQRPEPSYVLRAMGLTEIEAYSSVRFSVSILNTDEEIDECVSILANLVSDLRRFRVKHAIKD